MENHTSRTVRSIQWRYLATAVTLASLGAVALSACAGGGDDDETDVGTGGGGGADGAGTGGATPTTGGSTGTSVCDVAGATTEPASTAISRLDLGMGGGGVTESQAIEGWDGFPASPQVDLVAGGTGEFTFPADWADSPGQRAPVLTEDGPDTGDSHSVRFGGTGFKTYGAGVNFALGSGPSCQDLSAYAGVKFWARGWTKLSTGQTLPGDVTAQAGKIFFRVIAPGSNAKPNGDCDAMVTGHSCFQPPQVAITLPGEEGDLGAWKQYTVLFEDLATVHQPSSLAANLNRAQFVGWFSSPGDFDFEVSGVEWCAEADCGASVLE